MNQQDESTIHGPGYIAHKKEAGYEVEFDAGSHKPQDIKVF